MKPIEEECQCVRIRTNLGTIKKCYVVVSETGCDVKFPDEWDHQSQAAQRMIEDFCHAVTLGIQRLPKGPNQ